MDKNSYVYMMGIASRRALYTGVCADLRERVYEHKNGLIEGFTQKYKCHRLVYFEVFTNIKVAIAREKEIKGWRREKKDRLVETKNPDWKDLAADWFVAELQLHGKPVRLKEKQTQGPSGLLPPQSAQHRRGQGTPDSRSHESARELNGPSG